MVGKSGISPVITTIILVAVSIIVSIAVAYWLGGITTIFMRFETLSIEDTWIVQTENNWTINLKIWNKGTSGTSINSIRINDIPITAIPNVYLNGTEPENIDIAVPIGEEVLLVLTIDRILYKSGQTIIVTIHTTGGLDYSKTIVLP